MVYDLRNYKAANFWGPYQDTGDAKVDWEKMEAVMILLGFNLQMFRRHAHKCFTKHLGIKPFEGATPNSYVDMGLSPYRKRPVLAVPTLDHEIPRSPVASTMNDPYNVSVGILTLLGSLLLLQRSRYLEEISGVPSRMPLKHAFRAHNLFIRVFC